MRIPIFERESLDTPHRTLQTGLGTITESLYKDKKKTDDRGKLFERICGGRDGWGISPPTPKPSKRGARRVGKRGWTLLAGGRHRVLLPGFKLLSYGNL